MKFLPALPVFAGARFAGALLAGALLAGALSAVALSAVALSAVAQAPQVSPTSMGSLPEIMEAAQIQKRLEAARQKALTNPALSAQRDALEVAVKAAMTATDPLITAQLDKLAALNRLAEQLQAEGKEDELVVLAKESWALIQGLKAAERDALQSPSLLEQSAAFDAALHAQMTAIDPDVPRMEARLTAIFARLKRQADPSGPGAPEPTPRD